METEFLRFIKFISTITFSGLIYSECTFRESDYLSQLNDPAQIEELIIEVPKSSKFAKNFMKIISSPSQNIPPELKKNFKAKITRIYSFGSCKNEGKVKQSGDWRDHIIFKNGQPLRSLSVKISDGNIMNSVRFKLLIPQTREDLNEVFATVLLRELGYISPETFKVNVDMNGTKSLMIFQEDARKELLERNSRREGPIFEGDESLLWANGRQLENDNIALARMINENWFLKGEQSAKISLNSYKRIQEAYLTQRDNKIDFNLHIQPNYFKKEIFNHYHFISLALNAEHGLDPHNRKYYFNSFLNDFEPIYYDGDVKLERLNFKKNEILEHGVFRLSFNTDYVFPYIELINQKEFQENVTIGFSKRSGLSKSMSERFVKNAFKVVIENIVFLSNLIKETENFIDYDTNKSPNYAKYLDRIENNNIKQENIIESNIVQGAASITYQNQNNTRISLEDIAQIISDLELNQQRTVLIDKNISYLNNHQNSILEIGGKYVKSEGIDIKTDRDNKVIYINQKDPEAWILFIDSNFKDWKIFFKGERFIASRNSQRFNEFGMTGCLNFYNVNFNDTSIFATDGGCEDSVNIVSSYGVLKTLEVTNGRSDAIDVDFSNLKINFIRVNTAGNDCFDVSGGKFDIERIDVQNCGDKGVSVGEKSVVRINDLIVDNSILGISSKDHSISQVANANLNNTEFCYESAEKKQEFGGAILSFNKLDCTGKKIIGSKSMVNENEL